MGETAVKLRLTSDFTFNDTPDVAESTTTLTRPSSNPISTIRSLRDEIRQLQAEVALLRRRDDTVNHAIQQIDEEQRLAARLQRDFLPHHLPTVPGFNFSYLFRPASYVSGDLFDLARLDEHHLYFYLVDAVGHGMPAALLTMFLKQALRTKEITGNTYRIVPPGEALASLNSLLVEQDLSQATFATALYGIIDTRTSEVTVASAGHPSPLLIDTDGTQTFIPTDGGLLGIFADETFPETKVTVSPGQRLLIYTDGVEVAFSDEADNFDTERWRTILQNYHQLPPDDLLVTFAREIDGQIGSLSSKDDLTMVMIEFANGTK
jgi:sigma-B regulation protein RsbU (phosphoserine phosphatase)